MEKFMFKRTARKALLERLNYYPVVAVTGPRQSGKSTLIKTTLPNYRYVSLEDKDNLKFALDDPRGFLEEFCENVIIDEAQYAPELFSYIQTKTDAAGKNGNYVLSGSQNFLLSEKISQSLAGRVGIIKLLPCSYSELTEKREIDAQKFLHSGAYPGLHFKNIPPRIFYSDYLETYLERDVRKLANIGDLVKFENFLRVCASRIGSVLNVTDLSKTTGINVKTCHSWLSVLQSSYIVQLVSPYYKNFEKRITKSPKIYFYDTGLASFMLGIETPNKIADGAAEHLFENLVYNELLKAFYNSGVSTPNYFFWRENEKNEVDIILEKSQKIYGFEVKFSKTRNTDYQKSLNRFCDISGTPKEQMTVIYNGETLGRFVNWRDFEKRLSA